MRSTRTLGRGAEDRFFEGVRFAGEFFAGTSAVHRALEKLTRLLEEAEIDYAILGAMALNEYGYRRVTEDLNVLLTRAGLDELSRRCLGRGYVKMAGGNRGLRDTENQVDIIVALAGDFPGDGSPKPVAFPDPAMIESSSKPRFVPLETLLELKLASGISAAHRLRDLADVLELIRATGLPRELSESLDPTVREKYLELWTAAQETDRITDALL